MQLQSAFAPPAAALPLTAPASPGLAAGYLRLARPEDSTDGASGGGALEALCAALVADAPRAANDHVDRLLEAGTGADALCAALIPRAARRLGQMWEDDLLSFAAVAFGMVRLTAIARRLGPLCRSGATAAPHGRRAMFALVPGDTHALGVVLVADLFRRAGWGVDVELQATPAALARRAATGGVDLVGLSAACHRALPALTMTIRHLRAANHGLRVIAGGNLAAVDPAAVRAAGADGVVATLNDALSELERPLPRPTP